MPLVSDKKRPYTIRLSFEGIARLDALRAKLGFRRTGILLKAIRVCVMAHCCGGNESLYIKQNDAQIDQLRLHGCQGLDSTDMETFPVTLMVSAREKGALKRCGAKAGGIFAGAETALAFLEDVLANGFPELLEKRGNHFYPVLPCQRG